MTRLNCLRPVVLLSLLLAVILAGCTPSRASLPMPELASPSSFSPPTPESWTLENGLTVLYLENRELPLVRGTLYLPGGTIHEPASQNGVVSMMGTMLRQGGAGELSPDELDLELEKLSAGISSGIAGEFGSVSFSTLSGDLDRVFSLFSDVIFRPRFDAQRLALLKGQQLEGIRRRGDEPSKIAAVGMGQLLYGESPYGRVLLSKDLDHITPESVRRVYHEYLRPDRAIFTITGDVSRGDVERLLSASFAHWKRSGSDPSVAPPVEQLPRPGLYHVPGDFSQATIMVGQLGVPRHTHDQYAIQAFNEVFGTGGMASRLFGRVRTDLGLAYDASGAIMPSVVRGRNLISVQTKSTTAGKALREALRVLQELQEKPVSREELEEKKLATINSFVFANETADATLQRRALFRIYGYPLDFDDHYVKNVSSVTPEQVQEVARTRWRLEDLVGILVGDGRALTSVQEVQHELPALRGDPVVTTFDEKLRLPR